MNVDTCCETTKNNKIWLCENTVTKCLALKSRLTTQVFKTFTNLDEKSFLILKSKNWHKLFEIKVK